MKNIVITTDNYLPRWDGIARFLKELIPELAKKNKITIFAPKFEGKPPQYKNTELIRFPLINIQFGDIFFAKPNKKTMKEKIKKADLIFNNTIGTIGAAGIKIGHKQKKPIISYIHNVEWELASRAIKRFKWLAKILVKKRARKLYNKCTLLLAPNKEIEDLLTENKIKTRKEVVHLGVNIKKFKPAKSKKEAKKKININPKTKIIGFTGRIAREKNLPTLVKAFKNIRKKNKNIKLLIVGEGLEEEIPSTKTIIRTGKQDNIVPFLQAMDMFVLPSLTETSSLATMEAMACGIAPIVTPVGSIREYITDGKNGLIFPREDPKALQEKIEILLKNKKLRENMGKEARKTIVKKYNWKDTAKKIEEILRRF